MFKIIWETTVGKGMVSDTCNAVRDNNDTQRFATCKSIKSNAGNTIWNNNATQRRALIVFATHCISIDFVLNGRKVMALIL